MRIPVQGTFDVALARNMLRKQVAERGWVPSFRARAAAALTALTEIVLLTGARPRRCGRNRPACG